MVAISTLIIVLFLSLIMVRIGSEALVLTGLSRESAKFQARSAWTGTGFTTTEAEGVVNHPVRRRIIGLLMVIRSAGLVTAASTLMLSFVNVEERGQGFLRLLVLLAGLTVLLLIARSRPIEHWMSKLIAAALKRYTALDTHDYAGLLHLAGEYAIMELKVLPDSWVADRRLGDLRLPEEGVLVLGITRPDGTYIGAPRGDSRVHAGDTLVLYARSSELAALSKRRADARAEGQRREAVSEQAHVVDREKKLG